MKIKSIDWIYGVLAFLPLIVTGILLPAFPNTIPAHFNSAGQVDRYGNREELLILPVVVLVIALFFGLFFAFINNSTENKNGKLVNASKIVVILVFNSIDYAILISTYNTVHSKAVPDLFKICAILISLGDVVIANYLPKCRRNGLSGIRTKWTLASEEVWYKTHRFGGGLIAGGGIACIAVSLFLHGIACLYVVVAGEFLMIAILMIYSQRLYTREMRRNG